MSALHVASIGRLSGGDTAPRISHQRSLSGNVLNPRHPCSTACSRSCVVRASRRRGSTSGGQRVRPAGRTPDGNKGGRSLGLVEIEPDGSDLWRLDAVAECLRTGGVGIIPTDTFPAFVCDLEDKSAVQRLYEIKRLSPSQPLSILCSSFKDISEYTQGWQASNTPGQPDLFRLARQVLPGAYTFILVAGKRMPKQVVDYLTGKSKPRRTVGVRMPADEACQAVLELLEWPLLCSSIRPADQINGELPDSASLLDEFGARGLDFVVDNGRKFAEGSTVVDMTSSPPKVLRSGLGDAAPFEALSFATA